MFGFTNDLFHIYYSIIYFDQTIVMKNILYKLLL